MLNSSTASSLPYRAACPKKNILKNFSKAVDPFCVASTVATIASLINPKAPTTAGDTSVTKLLNTAINSPAAGNNCSPTSSFNSLVADPD